MSSPGSRVLLPIRLLEGETPGPAILDLLPSVPVLLLGYVELPSQTAPGQARMQFEEQALAELEQTAASLEARDGEVERRLVFTQDAAQTFERIAEEDDCTAICLARAAPPLARVVVPLRGEVNIERVVSFVGELVRDSDVDVLLVHVTDDEDATEPGRLVLRGAREHLVDLGVLEERIQLQVIVEGDPVDAILSVSTPTDAIVMGASEPTLSSVVFGEVHERIASRFEGPVVVVRRVHPDA